MKKKIRKKFLFFQRIPSHFVASECLYEGRIVALGTKCVRKRF